MPRPRWKPLAPVSLALCAALASAPARAQAQQGDASALLDEGLALRARRDDEAALQRFQAALALAPSARALAQVGLAEQALGRWVDAESHVAAALTHADPWVERNRGALTTALMAIRARLGSLEVHATPADARLSIDGRDEGLATPPRARRVVAGSVTIELRAEGYVPVVRALRVEPGAFARERFELVRRPTTPAPDRSRARAIAPTQSPLFVVGVALAAAGLVTAVGVGVTGELTADAYDARCPDNPVPPSDCDAVRVDTQRTLDAYTVVIPVAVGLAAAGVALVAVALVTRARTRSVALEPAGLVVRW